MTTGIVSNSSLATYHDADAQPPTSASSQLSAASGLSAASSKASSHLSQSSGYTSSSTAMTGTSSKIKSKPPTLDAIAARMKKTNLSDNKEGVAVENANLSSTDGE
jgi:hypothetical protein